MKLNVLEYLSDIVEDFYFKYFLHFTKWLNRSRKVSYLLKLFQFIQIISILFTSQSKQITEGDNENIYWIVTFLEIFRILPCFNYIIKDQYSSTIAFLVTSFTINILLCLFIPISAFYFNQTSHKNQLPIVKFFRAFISLTFQCYTFILLIPFTENCFTVIIQEQYPIGFKISAGMNLLFITLLDLIERVHDFSYSFKLKDFLGKRQSNSTVLLYFEFLLVQLLYSFEQSGLLQNSGSFLGFSCLYALTLLIDLVIEIPYYDPIISILHFRLTILLNMITIFIMMSFFFNLNSQFSYIFLFLLFIPISIRFADKFRNMLISTIMVKKSLKVVDSIKVDNQLRFIYNSYKYSSNYSEWGFQIEKFFQQYESLQSETSQTYNDIAQESNIKSITLLNENIDEDKFNDNQMKDKKRKIEQLIDTIYSEKIKELNSKNKILDSRRLSYSDLFFLIEVKKQPIRAFYKAKELQQDKKQKLSITDRLMIEQTIKQIKVHIDKVVKEKKIVNQFIEMEQVIEFDETLRSVQTNILQAFSDLGNLCQLLIEYEFDMNEFFLQSSHLIKLIEKIQLSIDKCTQIYPYSSTLHKLSLLFYKQLNYNTKKSSEIIKNSKKAFNKTLNFDQSKGYDFIFSKNVGVISVNIFNRIGEIEKCTKSFLSLFNFHDKNIGQTSDASKYPQKNKQVIQNKKHHTAFFMEEVETKESVKEQKINDDERQSIQVQSQNKMYVRDIMPSFFQDKHDELMRSLSQMQKMSKVFNRSLFSFIIDGNQHLVPVTVFIQYSNIHDTIKANVCIQKQKNLSDYILFSKTGFFHNITESFFQDTFKTSCPSFQSSKDINGLSVVNFLPDLIPFIFKQQI